MTRADPIPVIDLFAGPGGLGERFSAALPRGRAGRDQPWVLIGARRARRIRSQAGRNQLL
jgi:hypothetical protein